MLLEVERWYNGQRLSISSRTEHRQQHRLGSVPGNVWPESYTEGAPQLVRGGKHWAQGRDSPGVWNPDSTTHDGPIPFLITSSIRGGNALAYNMRALSSGILNLSGGTLSFESDPTDYIAIGKKLFGWRFSFGVLWCEARSLQDVQKDAHTS